LDALMVWYKGANQASKEALWREFSARVNRFRDEEESRRS
jgi:hypothetical protein